MTLPQLEIQLIASVVALACSLVGVFLVLRKMAMTSDAISHTVLLGIVVSFFLVRDLNSPILIIGAAATGVLTISLVELLEKTKLIREDAAIGLTFPALFSIAVILISRFAGNIHLDNDSVLLGELAFAPFDRLVIGGVDLGPKALIVMAVIFLINLSFIVIFYKELKISTFDAGLAAALGFMPGVIHYGLMSLVSITAVGAFDAVGSILVVGLMIGPAASAYLLTDHLPFMLGLSAAFGVSSAISGYWLSNLLDVSIAGSMAVMVGVFFMLTFLFAPERGIVALVQRKKRQKWEFSQMMLVIHLHNHESMPDAEYESRRDHLYEHMRWDPEFARQVIRRATRVDWIEQVNGHLALKDKGRKVAREMLSISQKRLD